LLGAAVVAVPLFRRLGLGSVLGYLAAGLAIGPFGLELFTDPLAILHVAELGVVMFLFVIGLEMKPSHLWSLRRSIFGLGTLQIAVCALAMTAVMLALGFSLRVGFIGALGFVLTSTAIVMQVLAERGDIALPGGQRIIAILLFEDLLIVPLLIMVAFMAHSEVDADAPPRWQSALIAVGTLVGLVAAGLWLLNPMFRVLARSRAREVMTAAALLVVLGAAALMEVGGLSMAMGAFVAGVLLSGSSFRHQIEADIEPFRGILLGLFFLSVGMALDLAVVADSWRLLLVAVPALMVAKATCIYLVARRLGTDNAEALDRAVVMAQGGEFAFVLYSAAAAGGVIDGPSNARFTAMVVLSMALTPLAMIAARRLIRAPAPSLDGIEEASGLSGSVLLIGFGRFGQIVSQALLARDVDVTIIDHSVDRIRNAERFGFKIYYGDGTRLDVLKAAGADKVRAICICVDGAGDADRIVELARSEFPQARLLVRAYDRVHSIRLIREGVDYQVRATFESAVVFGGATLRELGVPPEEADEICADVRRRDAERLELQVAGDIFSGQALLTGNAPGAPEPTPLVEPRRESQPLSDETAAVTADKPPPT
ncbi:MAG TPA: monovalent cation:proton antiporter-2 (CPA2) family protein, partial [Kofleriaceae bacterium]|nr:monovalent cation:proton antiporter-2 (CPA2) family protein [Kofleriaceae bacterium]